MNEQIPGKGWLAAWRVYVQICCHGIAPGAAHTYQIQCSSLWAAGELLSPHNPLEVVERYLTHRKREAAQRGVRTPKLAWLVEDLPGWIDQLQVKPKRVEGHTMSGESLAAAQAKYAAEQARADEYIPPPPEFLRNLRKIGNGGR